jgi:hypothetical protein
LESRIGTLELSDLDNPDVFFAKHYPTLNWPKLKQILKDRDRLFEEHKKEARKFDPIEMAQRERAYNEETEEIIRMHADLVRRKREAAANREMPSVFETRANKLLHNVGVWERELHQLVQADKLQDAIRNAQNTNARKTAQQLDELLQRVVADHNKNTHNDKFAQEVQQAIQQFQESLQPIKQRLEGIKAEDRKDTEDLLEFNEEANRGEPTSQEPLLAYEPTAPANKGGAAREEKDDLDDLVKEFSLSLDTPESKQAQQLQQQQQPKQQQQQRSSSGIRIVDRGEDVEFAATPEEKIVSIQEQIERDRELYDRFRFNRLHHFYQQELKQLEEYLDQFDANQDDVHK